MKIGQIWTNSAGKEDAGIVHSVGVDNLVVLACVLRATTKKVVNFFGEDPSYA